MLFPICCVTCFGVLSCEITEALTFSVNQPTLWKTVAAALAQKVKRLCLASSLVGVRIVFGEIVAEYQKKTPPHKPQHFPRWGMLSVFCYWKMYLACHDLFHQTPTSVVIPRTLSQHLRCGTVHAIFLTNWSFFTRDTLACQSRGSTGVNNNVWILFSCFIYIF